jgi:hypothetical protein
MKIPASVLSGHPARFGSRLSASPLRPQVVNFLAIHGDRWRRHDADPNAVPFRRDDREPDVSSDHHFLTGPSR